MYLNVIKSSDSLSPEFQRRVFRVARNAKDEDLAAALAVRPDTLPELDAELGAWGSARVQSAWFARPGRDMSATIQSLRKEKRVTILEVIAGIPELTPEVYEVCVQRNATRVAYKLVSNDSVPIEMRCRAAGTLAQSYETISYQKQHQLLTYLTACDTEVPNSFIKASTEVSIANKVMNGISALEDDTAAHVAMMCTTVLTKLPRLYALKLAESKAQSASRWYYGWSDFSDVLQSVTEATKYLSILLATEPPHKDEIIDLAEVLEKVLAAKEGPNDTTYMEYVKSILANCNSTGETGPSISDMARTAGSKEQLLEIATSDRDTFNKAAAVAVLCNPHADTEVAITVAKEFGWGESAKVLEAKNREIKPEVKAVLMVDGHLCTDDHIRKFAASTTPQELWRLMIAYASTRKAYGGFYGIPADLLSSAYASVDVVPLLPLRLYSHPDLPGWLVSAFAAYLSVELKSTDAWDSFEVLAPRHLGNVAQVIRASKITSKKAPEQSSGVDE
jgi:hypothetical protein